MNIIYMMIPISLFLGAGFLAAFVWSIRDGQNDDLITPPHRIFEDSDGGYSD